MTSGPFKKLLLAGVVFGSVLTSPATGQSYLAAIESFRSGDFEGAEQLFEQALNESRYDKPKRITALRFLARTRYALGNKDGARSAITSLIESEPPIVEFDPDVAAPPVLRMYYDVRKEQTQSFRVEAPSEQEFETISVVDFSNNAIGPGASDYDRLSWGLSATMHVRLRQIENVRVVERERLQWLLSEIQFQQESDLVDQSTAVQAGRLLGVQAVFLGNFIVNKKRLLIGARLVKVETGEILFAEQVDGKVDQHMDLMQELTEKVAESLGSQLKPGAASTPESSFEAMLAYSEGLQLLESENYEAAHQAFERAAEMGHEGAAVRAESLLEVL